MVFHGYEVIYEILERASTDLKNEPSGWVSPALFGDGITKRNVDYTKSGYDIIHFSVVICDIIISLDNELRHQKKDLTKN